MAEYNSGESDLEFNPAVEEQRSLLVLCNQTSKEGTSCNSHSREYISLSPMKHASANHNGCLDSEEKECVGDESDKTFSDNNTGDNKIPFFFCRWTATSPYIVFGVTLYLHVSVLILSIILFFTEFPILNVEFRGIPLEVRQSSILMREKSLFGFKYRNIQKFKPNISTSTRTNLEKFFVLYDTATRQHFGDFIFEEKGGNVLSAENLRKMYAFEKEILNDPHHHCMVQDCLPYSILRLFDGSLISTSMSFYDPSFSDIPGIINEALHINGTRALVEPLLSKTAVINDSVVISDKTFTSFYSSHYPNEHTGNLKYWAKKFDEWHEDGYKGLTIYLTSFRYYLSMTVRTIYRDMYLTCGSCLFIFLFIWFETNSLWLSFWGIASTLFSFVTGNFIYSVVFGFRYFGILHVLSIFIIFGIAADDIFIFCDTWKATGAQSYLTLSQRLAACYVRAAKAMFITSLTTAAAFFASSFSSILLISSFGIFSGVVILINYLSVIIFYPSVVIIYHLKFENLGCNSRKTEGYKSRVMVRFLSNTYFSFIQNRVFQIISLLCVTTFVIISIFFITTIRIETKEPKLVRSTEKIEQHFDIRYSSFKAVDPIPTSHVFIMWGLEKTINATRNCGNKEYRRECYWNWDTLFDQGFDLNPDDAQKDLLTFCEYLHNMNDSMMEDLKVSQHPITGQREIYCFLDSIKKALWDSSNVTFPVTSHKVQQLHSQWLPNLLSTSPNLPPKTNYSNVGQSNRSMEDLYLLWANNRYIDKVDYGLQIGIDHENPPDFGERFAYVGIKVVVKMNRLVDTYPTGLRVYDRWERLVKDHVRGMSATMRDGFQTSNAVWSWFELMRALVWQGVATLGLGLICAWFILVLSCGNWVIGTMATVCIACICVSVVGMIGMIGWKYGVLETLNTTLVVGLAIDYVVHFGVAYTSSPHSARRDRVQYALAEIGLPVISGAATTLGSSFFMLFSRLQFLFQFSIFMFCTIGFAILYCMTAFLVALLLVGPQGETGSTAVVGARIRKLFRRDGRARP